MTTEPAENQTHNEYLETHDLTRELKRLGVTNDQLQAMRFRGTNKGWPFDQWTFTWLCPIGLESLSLVRAYCALKWLILETPTNSRDTEDAWRLVGETMAAPTLAMGERTRRAQSERAKKPRGKITDGGTTIGQIIGYLAVGPQYQGNRAKELWPHFFALLDKEGLNPKETVDPENSQKWTYEYGFRDGRKKITFRRFENIVARARARKKSH